MLEVQSQGESEKGKSQADFPSFCNPQTCCNWDAQKGEYIYPAKKHLQQYRVLITTLITASRYGMDRICFSLVSTKSKGILG